MTNIDLATQHCHPRNAETDGLKPEQVNQLLAQLPGWTAQKNNKSIVKNFTFDDFHRTLGFINAVGFMANGQDHHPDLEAGYGHCQITWSTHDVGGLSLNDFICAAKVERLLTK